MMQIRIHVLTWRGEGLLGAGLKLGGDLLAEGGRDECASLR